MGGNSGSAGQLAGLGSRIGAILIDQILAGILMTMVVLLLAAIVGDSVQGGGAVLLLLSYLFIGALYLGYFIVMEWLFGYTIGKKLVSIRVVDESGGQIDMGKSAVRNFLRIVDVLPSLYILGIVLIAVSDDEQRLGDMAASTYVVKG